MKYLVILLTIVFICWLARYEKNKLGNIVSPSLCFLVPTFVVALLYDFTGPYWGFYNMASSIYVEIFVASLIFSLGGLFANRKSRMLSLSQRESFVVEKENVSRHISFYLIAFSLIVWTILMLKLYSLGGALVLEEDDLQKQFASNGLFGHIFVIDIFLLTYYLSIVVEKKQKLIKAVLILLLFLPPFFYQVKGWMILPIVVSVIYKKSIGLKQNILKYVLIALTIVVCFLLGYCINYNLSDADDQTYLLGHFLKYFFAGIGGWSEAVNCHFQMGQNPYYLLKPFSDIIGITQDKAYYGYSYVVINYNGEYTNVFTLIGNSICFAGRLYAYIYIFFLGLGSYLFANSVIKSSTVGMNLAYSIFATALAFGFFGSYFTMLNIYEMIFYGLMVNLFVKNKTL